MSNTVDYYEILGIGRNATTKEIIKAYKKLALKYHPDRNLNNPKQAAIKFQQISEAAQILRDPKKKNMYDTYGVAEVNNIQPQDLFNMVFHDDDVKLNEDENILSQININISLKDCYCGISRQIQFKYQYNCDACQGNGSISTEKSEWCKSCVGTGAVKVQKKFDCSNCRGIGRVYYDESIECSKCTGSGRYWGRSCSKCSGAGVIDSYKCSICDGSGNYYKKSRVKCSTCNGNRKNYTVSKISCNFCQSGHLKAWEKDKVIKIPAGSCDGDIIRVYYENYEKQVKGTVLVKIKCNEENNYTRKGNDLYINEPVQIGLCEALMGGNILIKHFNENLFIQPNYDTINSDEYFVIKNKGMRATKQRSNGGNLFVKFQIIMPENLSRKCISKICNLLPEKTQNYTSNKIVVELEKPSGFDLFDIDDDDDKHFENDNNDNEKAPECKQM